MLGMENLIMDLENIGQCPSVFQPLSILFQITWIGTFGWDQQNTELLILPMLQNHGGASTILETVNWETGPATPWMDPFGHWI
jgi:hypothetical protein